MFENRKICVFGGASLYRLPLYNLMAETLDCDFYITKFGDGRDRTIKSYNYSDLNNFKGENILKPLVAGFNWNTSIFKLFRMPYHYYVVAGAWDLSSWVLIFLCAFTKKKVYSWSHGMYGRETGIRLWLKRLFFKLCDKNIVYNERSRNLMIDGGINPDNVISVHNSLDYNVQLQYRNSFSDIYRKHFNNSNPVLFFIGRLIEDKQLNLLIEVAFLLKKKGKPVNVVLIGDGPSKHFLVEQAEELGVRESVWLYGPCYDEREKSELISNADLCVTPGAIGLTCMDSMMYGTPVITNDDFNHQGPEHAAIQDGVTGTFFKAGDVNDLACQIEAWLSNTNSRDQIRENCYKEIDNFWTPQYEVEQLGKIF